MAIQPIIDHWHIGALTENGQSVVIRNDNGIHVVVKHRMSGTNPSGYVKLEFVDNADGDNPVAHCGYSNFAGYNIPASAPGVYTARTADYSCDFQLAKPFVKLTLVFTAGTHAVDYVMPY